MGTVIMHNVVSVDGFIADEDDQVGPLFEWYGNGEHTLAGDREDTTGELKVSKASIDYVRPTWAAIGAMVIGRHLFDMTNGWEGRPPAGEHVVVVSHRPKPDGWHPEASYSFVDDIAAAVAKAKDLAATARSRWRRATSAARRWRRAWWTRWRWTSCRWSSAPASATSAPSRPSTCSRTPTS